MNQKVMMKIMQWMLVAVVSLIIGGSAGFVTTVHAAENTASTAVTQGQPVADATTGTTDSADANTAASGFFLLAGGMLILILAVVITVVSTFISSAAIVDEL